MPKIGEQAEACDLLVVPFHFESQSRDSLARLDS
jgi:hypothetical protein